MFYEVRIFDGQGKLKKRIGTKELSKRFWRKMQEAAKGKNPQIQYVDGMPTYMDESLASSGWHKNGFQFSGEIL